MTDNLNKKYTKYSNKGSTVLLVVVGLLTLQLGCSAISTPVGGLTLTGTLATATDTNNLRLDLGNGLLKEGGMGNSALLSRNSSSGSGANFAVNYSTMTLACTSQDGKSTVSAAKIASNGTFSLPVTSGANVPISCTMKDAEGIPNGVIVVSDSTSKDIRGTGAQTSDQMKLSGNTSMGTITYNPKTQEAIVSSASLSTIVKDSLTASSGFDPSGLWTIGAPDVVDAGYEGPCATQGGNCNGPSIGMTVYMNRLTGTNTADSTPVFGLQLWQSEAAKTACGNKTGLSTAQATAAGVSITGGGTAGAFTFANTIPSYTSPVTELTVTNDTLTDGYKLGQAKNSYELQTACGPKSVTVGGNTYNAWVCDDSAGHYQVGLGGGCVNGAGTAVNIRDWSQVTGMSCEAPAAVAGATGYFKNSCTGTYSTEAITCTNTSGTFSDVALTTVTDQSDFDWSAVNSSKIATSTLCSAADYNSYPLQRAQCYAQYYQNALGNQGATSACVPKVNTNWTATTAADFVSVDFKPSSLIFMDKLSYQVSPDGIQTGVLRTTQDNYNGVEVSDGTNKSWIPCKVHEVNVLRLTSLSASKMKATYAVNSMTTDTDKPACVGAFGKAGSTAAQKFQFNLTR